MARYGPHNGHKLRTAHAITFERLHSFRMAFFIVEWEEGTDLDGRPAFCLAFEKITFNVRRQSECCFSKGWKETHNGDVKSSSLFIAVKYRRGRILDASM